MDQEERKMLERTAAMAEENNKILRKMQRSARIGKILHILYWVIIIAAAIVGYIFIQPYIEALGNAYTEAQGTLDSLKDIENPFGR